MQGNKDGIFDVREVKESEEESTIERDLSGRAINCQCFFSPCCTVNETAKGKQMPGNEIFRRRRRRHSLSLSPSFPLNMNTHL
jgi:hypothetical protein